MSEENERQESVADVVAMLRANARGERFDDFSFSSLADRIDAAWRRELEAKDREIEALSAKAESEKRWADHYFEQAESGASRDAAAMREAAEAALSELDKFGPCHDARIHFSDIVHIGNAKGMLRAALSAPARNCNRYADEAEARSAFIDWYNTVYELKGDKWNEVAGRWLRLEAQRKRHTGRLH